MRQNSGEGISMKPFFLAEERLYNSNRMFQKVCEQMELKGKLIVIQELLRGLQFFMIVFSMNFLKTC